MFKLHTDILTGKLTTIERLQDNAFIPFDPANSDYAEYLKWLEAGNQPLPPEEN